MPDGAALKAQAVVALEKGDNKDAIELLTRAIEQIPTSIDYYIKRSNAYQRDKQYDMALRDSEKAVKMAGDGGKRELIGQAQFRRGIAFYMKDNFASAKQCFEWAEKYDGEKKLINIWKSKLSNKDISSQSAILEFPDIENEAFVHEASSGLRGGSQPLGGYASEISSNSKQSIDIPLLARQSISETTDLPAKVRHEWYQTASHVIVTLFVKNIPKEKIKVEITPTSLSVSFPNTKGSEFAFDIDPFAHQVSKEESSFRALSTKLEVHLKKVEPKQWNVLEGAEESKPQGIEYPTSSRKGAKNWDSIANETKEDDDSGNPDALFKHLFKDADEDMKRAMMKSYVESNGTALSTDWRSVSKEKVECLPPDVFLSISVGPIPLRSSSDITSLMYPLPPLASPHSLSGIAGSISIACWVVVFSPQIIENYKRRSGDGLSLAFLWIWLLGDVFNVAGALFQGIMPTMTILAFYYTLADVVLILQVHYYRKYGNKLESFPEHLSETEPLIPSVSTEVPIFEMKQKRALIRNIAYNTTILFAVWLAGFFAWILLTFVLPRSGNFCEGASLSIPGKHAKPLCSNAYD
ncbi:Cochaperone protein, regulates activity of adenylyl cyclase Cyr1p [Neolecta irregularis DAH-3]|uniref:Cochaperone protein, regulates activity of adenylyl cyclase Cyr1p n=1 Tax=Neolecta irregularis (strain DAH-3) TaxID=1198029 RepID=A0A1U7LUJ5_NEOID|nr:Cochaperone protein, regulates activity of adenylyl cyclase Cyr1p [Neolecta irregularis DAH-3]|eukprot:OLL26337.1 Cochaperone protein, regulates activity of adenylyl cyclase Cyr1p [Neolecta irregularis DAH-3]